MISKKIKDAIEYYESLNYEEREKLQTEFGQHDIGGREIKFFNWLSKIEKKMT